MGWCSGTVIFDTVVEAILNPEVDKKETIKYLINALEDMDWDCQPDSDYWEHPLVKECFIETGKGDWYEND